jgi:hypothetical protein
MITLDIQKDLPTGMPFVSYENAASLKTLSHEATWAGVVLSEG